MEKKENSAANIYGKCNSMCPNTEITNKIQINNIDSLEKFESPCKHIDSNNIIYFHSDNHDKRKQTAIIPVKAYFRGNERNIETIRPLSILSITMQHLMECV